MAKKLKVDHKVDMNIQIIGISSTIKDYRMAQIVNKSLGIELLRLPGMPVYHEKAPNPSTHSIYIADDELNRRYFHLIKNRSEGWNAMQTNPTMDFHIIIGGKAKASEMKKWLAALRSDQAIMMVMEIKSDQVKALDSLLTDIEMHLLDLKMKLKEGPAFPPEVDG